MTRRIRMPPVRIFVCLLALVLAGCGGNSSSAPPPQSTPSATSVASILAGGIEQGVDGFWAYVEDSAGKQTALAAGVENADTLAPARSATRFRIASISKLFLATAAVKAVEDGLLRLDDTLAFWLPGEAAGIANSHEITVQQLLQHRSGIPDFDSQPGFSWRQSHDSEDALLALIDDLPADFAPDARYAYSNSNYLLLGRILTAALGYDHRDYIQNTILSPLGLVDTFVAVDAGNAQSIARGYWDGIDVSAQTYTIPGGAMVSTARDVGVFLRELSGGALLNASERQRFEQLFDGYGHSGWLPGYQGRSQRMVGSDVVVVLFANTTGGDSEAVTDRVFARLRALALVGTP